MCSAGAETASPRSSSWRAQGLVGLQAKEVWTLRKAPVAYSIELPTGRIYDTLSTKPQATELDAFDAVLARVAAASFILARPSRQQR